jgi:hypothetical protein
MLSLDVVLEVGVVVPAHLEDRFVGDQPERVGDAVEDDAPPKLLDFGEAGLADWIGGYVVRMHHASAHLPRGGKLCGRTVFNKLKSRSAY